MQKYTKEERQQYKRLYMDIADDIYDSNIVRQDRIIEKINSAVTQGFPVDFYTTPYSVSLLTLAA